MERTETHRCQWCSLDFTYVRTGPGKPPIYCSEACKREAQNALAAGRMKRKRERDQGRPRRK